MKPYTLVLLMGVAVLFASCGSPIIRTVQHTPLHANNNAAVTFKVTAESDPKIDRVTLNIYEYELYVNNDGFRAARPRTGGHWGQANVWNISPSQSNVDLSFNYPTGFPAGSWVQYEFIVHNTDNKNATRTITMQAGDSPWGNGEILLYSAADDAPVNTIDVCFVPDGGDYSGNIRQFLTDLEGTIYNGYLKNNMIKNNSTEWAFYYTPATGNASSRTVPSAVSASPLIDVFAIIHSTVFRDAASGNVFSTEHFNVGTAVHETAHAVFDLRDEYCCDSYYAAACNLWTTQGDCQAANTASGFPASDCESFTANDTHTYWRPEPGALHCIMNDDGDATMPDFARTCQGCIISFYVDLDRR